MDALKLMTPFTHSPLRPLVITSPFGPRPAPGGPLHPGVDCMCSLSQPVYAVADAEVLHSYLSPNDPPTARYGRPPPAGWRGRWPKTKGYGECVILGLEDGRCVRYAHLCQRLVYQGQTVRAGTAIGYAGSSGWSSGAHLHFEVREDHGLLDPAPLLAAFLVVPEGAPS